LWAVVLRNRYRHEADNRGKRREVDQPP